MSRIYDLIVVGAGPAGTTLASIYKKYSPKSRVLILDKCEFPRHKVGESLLPGMIPVLKEMGVFEKIDSAGFPRKFGAVFVWGKDRAPWDADFNNLNLEMLNTYGRLLDTEFSWQALRSRYDRILLEHARSLGAQTRLGWRAVKPIESGGAVTGLVAEGPDGERLHLRCRTLADCSGQTGFLSPARRTRGYRPDLNNVAAYAYFKGARWKFSFQGHPDKTKIFICSVPEGWFWYIPLAKDLVSVGLVSKADQVKGLAGHVLRDRFLKAVRSCREISPLLRDAELARGLDPAHPDKDFFTAADWSYINERACGPGWVAAGDAAFFIDPLLSSGVMMAHLSGHRAAYTLLTAEREADPKWRKSLWADYNRFCREIPESFLALVQYWYHNDPHAKRWWSRARRALRAAAPLDLDDKMSFVAVAAGLSYHFEGMYSSQPLIPASAGIEHAWQWEGTKAELRRWTRQIIAIVETGFVKRAAPDAKTRAASRAASLDGIPDHWIPRWVRRGRRETTFLPTGDQGRLRPIQRLVFNLDGAKARRVLPRSHLAACGLIDGKRTVGALREKLEGKLELPADLIADQVFRLLKDLHVLGVMDFKREKHPRPTTRRPSVRSAFRSGEAALRAGRPEQAERLLTRAVAAGFSRPWVLALRGEARRHLGRGQAALADLNLALKRSGQTLKEVSFPAGAVAAFDAAITQGWIADRILVFRAKLFLDLGRHRKARDDAQAALALNPRNSEALVLRAKASISLGDPGAARPDLKAALAIATGRKGEG